jgi:hypothetical protein
LTKYYFLNENNKSLFTEKRMNTSKIYLIFLLSLLFVSCANIKAGLYLIFVDRYNGQEIKNNEPNVRSFLENALSAPENYNLEVYKRTGISAQFKKTKLLEHSFYVISDQNGEFHTISFYGTAIAFFSQGTWAMDSDSDLSSYNMYLKNSNKWDVSKVNAENGINVEGTIKNIINKLDMHVTFYYKDHIKKKLNMNNCNTAMKETVVYNKPVPLIAENRKNDVF